MKLRQEWAEGVLLYTLHQAGVIQYNAKEHTITFAHGWISKFSVGRQEESESLVNSLLSAFNVCIPRELNYLFLFYFCSTIFVPTLPSPQCLLPFFITFPTSFYFFFTTLPVNRKPACWFMNLNLHRCNKTLRLHRSSRSGTLGSPAILTQFYVFIYLPLGLCFFYTYTGDSTRNCFFKLWPLLIMEVFINTKNITWILSSLLTFSINCTVET